MCSLTHSPTPGEYSFTTCAPQAVSLSPPTPYLRGNQSWKKVEWLRRFSTAIEIATITNGGEER